MAYLSDVGVNDGPVSSLSAHTSHHMFSHCPRSFNWKIMALWLKSCELNTHTIDSETIFFFFF